MIGLNKAAKALAMTAFDVCENVGYLHAIRSEFEDWKRNKQNKQ
jgi:hypothetical protein